MNKWLIILAGTIFASFSQTAFGREGPIDLANYVRSADTICVCTVKKENEDKSVTVQVDEVLKGKPAMSLVVRAGRRIGDVASLSLSYYMRPKEQYLVFLFNGNTVSSNSNSILKIVDGNVTHAHHVQGFTGVKSNEKTKFVPLEEAVKQIRALRENG